MSLNVCNLKAFDLCGQPYEFTLKDAPVEIGDNRIILTNKHHSPILRRDKILMGSDIGIYLGDVIEDELGERYVMIYNSGFQAINIKSHTSKMLYDIYGHKVVSDVWKEGIENDYLIRAKIKFKCGEDSRFQISNVLGVYENQLIVSGIKNLVDFDNVRQDLIATRNKHKFFLGEKYKGRTVYMCYGRICISTEFGAYDVLARRYIIRRKI